MLPSVIWASGVLGFHSMTSSAVASNECGTLRPSALAVSRLITSSNFVGACTGRSAGLSPAERRNWSLILPIAQSSARAARNPGG